MLSHSLSFVIVIFVISWPGCNAIYVHHVYTYFNDKSALKANFKTYYEKPNLPNSANVSGPGRLIWFPHTVGQTPNR